jgi:pimeloyl-ACP methyl ester carboxylesterase
VGEGRDRRAERVIESDGVRLCTEPFGAPTDPPVLLVMGLGAVDALVGGGALPEPLRRRAVRDPVRPPRHGPIHEGRTRPPRYGGDDLVADAARVLDAYGLPSAHVVGVSAAGASRRSWPSTCPDRVLSLVLISTSPAVPVDRDLPPPAEGLGRFLAGAEVDWSDRESVIEYLVGYARSLAGADRPFDEAACRDLVRRDVERTDDVAALQNHDVMDPRRRASCAAVVDHCADVGGGPRDGRPAVPARPRSRARRGRDPGATLLPLDGAGHGVDRPTGRRSCLRSSATRRPPRPTGGTGRAREPSSTRCAPSGGDDHAARSGPDAVRPHARTGRAPAGPPDLRQIGPTVRLRRTTEP